MSGGKPGAADHVPAWLDRAAYPFQHCSMNVGGVRVHYVDEGAGEPIVFVHGTPTWSFEFRHLIRALSPSFRCIALDLPGFGLSSRPASFAYTPEAHSKVVAEFIERLTLPRFTLVVHDFGGPIALPVAIDHPEQVHQLVVINTWMWSFDDDPDMAKKGKLAGGAVGRFLYKHANASLRLIMPSAYGTRAKLTREIHRQYLEPFRRPDDRVLVLHALARALLGSKAHYDSLWRRGEQLRDRRALIIWGMKDSAFLPKQLERWTALLPQAQVVRLPTAGHWPHEEEPSQVVDAIRAFLTQRS